MTQSLSDVNTGSVGKNAFLCPLLQAMYVHCTAYIVHHFCFQIKILIVIIVDESSNKAILTLQHTCVCTDKCPHFFS